MLKRRFPDKNPKPIGFRVYRVWGLGFGVWGVWGLGFRSCMGGCFESLKNRHEPTFSHEGVSQNPVPTGVLPYFGVEKGRGGTPSFGNTHTWVGSFF